ncbi:Unconventional myosin-IXa [Bagarius yarrelli]|uniref:Unconventional myosin-IXa n=1 Tax=Bagarius yarrelli TaxID=175774 RepID=A0A556U0X2_BAGYA|nr:Unconventional myosin-IXa [Bagarius yarrelli]
MSIRDVGGRRRCFEDAELTLRVYPGAIAVGTIYCAVVARKRTTAAEVIEQVIARLRLDRTKCYVLAEVKEFGGEEWILNPSDCPAQRMMLWPRAALENRSGSEDYRFLLREKNIDGSIHYSNVAMWLQLTEERRRMVERGLLPPPQLQDHDDLCKLPDLSEKTLLDNLRTRFKQEKIYTYVGSILVAINPFKFLPVYNPKYVKMYDNHQLGKLEPHIYAVADVAYHAMLKRRRNQCIVISGESGSGKTQSTNFLIHHLTALSQKGFASGVEQIILGAGPVLEAFGNAKTAHNNNSSRFGKFIQVNYQESGTVRGAYVEKYLLEKSRLVYQEHNERNYHVFYYLLAGASEEERTAFHLLKPEEYHYLSQMTKKPQKLHWENYYENELDCFTVEGEDLKHDFERLQLAMEMVGFLPITRKQIFSLLSAILHLGNIRYKKKTYRDDSIDICNPDVLPIVSELLEVKEEMLFEALTTRKTVTAGTVRDSMAKSLYSALFDWIVFRINHALLNNRELEESTKILSIGVLDIFGFEDYENNSFEQFCINFANERLQHYFNQHIFKLEQEEYRAEGITWHNIDYIDNTGCINLISKKPTALLHLLDEECNFPQATNQTLLDKFKRQHEGNSYIEFPAVMEPAFIIRHYAGKVKYGVKDFREKNTDHMRPDIVALLKSSRNAFISGLIGIDPVATFRWAVLRAYCRAVVAFREAGRRYVEKKHGHDAAAPCAVLKSVDSFSFLHHPVHQRSLEILQRCKEEKYSVSKRTPRTPLSDLQGSNNECSKRDGRNGRSGRQSRLSSGSLITDEDGIFLSSTSSKLLERAHGILMRNKNYKMKPSLPKTSLNKLMETLGQSEPYFVKCIRSNAEKLPLRFNDALVLRQLRYTGMLETVRIRQSGYSIKYTFQDFVRHFRGMLPENLQATQEDIRNYLHQVDLPPDCFQVGRTMVFMREVARQRLQDLLHREVLRRIVNLQRRFRAVRERKSYLRMKHATCLIQDWWRSCQAKQRDEQLQYGNNVRHGAAICIQSAWRGFHKHRQFLLWKEAVLVIQRNWRMCCYRRGQAAVVIQAAWRSYKAREQYNHQRHIIILFQSACRGLLARQRFRKLREQKLKDTQLLNGQTSPYLEEEKLKIMGLDVSMWDDRSRGVRERIRQRHCEIETPQEELHLKDKQEEVKAQPQAQVVIREKMRPFDESNLKTRAKRESRRMRELEQAKFSLELLKVRSTGATSPSEDRHCYVEFASDGAVSPQGTPDSQSSKGSFELVSMDDYGKDKMPCDEAGDTNSWFSTPPEHEVFPSSPRLAFNRDPLAPGALSSSTKGKPDHLSTLPKLENSLPTFYIPSAENSSLLAKSFIDSSTSPPAKLVKNRRESSRRPVVVLISMKKESVVDAEDMKPPEIRNSSAQTSEPFTGSQGENPTRTVLERLERLNEAKQERQKHQQQQNEKEMMEQIRQQKEILEKQRKHFAQFERELFEKQRNEALQRIEQSRQERSVKNADRSPPIAQPEPDLIFSLQTQEKPTMQFKTGEEPKDQPDVSKEWSPKPTKESQEAAAKNAFWKPPTLSANNNMTEQHGHHFFLPKDMISVSKIEKELSSKDKSAGVQKEAKSSGSKSIKDLKGREVARPGHKKARMARTRSDFLTRGSNSPGEGESEEEEYDETTLSLGPPLPKRDSEVGTLDACHSDSEMPSTSNEEKRVMQKAMSSGDLGKTDSLRKISHGDGRVRGKMRFWGKTKQGEKKSSRDRLVYVGESVDMDYPDTALLMAEGECLSAPHSPEFRSLPEFKENKEPSPKMKRRRSVKISSSALEPAQWQNDALQILTCANDYKSMNEFLMKKIGDLDTEDSKKDTMVDVVFKKALKEFRINIFNSYSTALAMDDGKSIRYKDLHALFEQILEKSMRQEQRDWSESPVCVWVNTFKVFLDEFMTEYKPLDSSVNKVIKPDRKKRRKKETDIVEEHNGHIFKSTQYSIPTYCEFCSSLIWMMDRACVCKLCRYACHRKCCLKATTKCSKKYDPELSSRQFSVDVSRLTHDDRSVPLVVEKLINYIEMHGLYTEGIYRKSGSANKIKELKQSLDTDVSSTNLDDYNIHVIASVFKQWLRDLPNPLLTFELYEEFLRAMGLQDKKEVLRSVYSVIDQLSRTHLNTLERLVFHLVRIALQEETNRMSANALAIVFAPCILRCPDTIDPLQSVQDISKTTACVELIICEQMNKYKARLKDINTLEFAECKAKSRLTIIRRSMGKGRPRKLGYLSPSPPVSPRSPFSPEITEESGDEDTMPDAEVMEQQHVAMEQEERVLTEQIENLQKEKEELTYEMLSLEPRASDDETLESEASIGTADSSENLNIDSEGAISDFSEKGPTLSATRPKKTQGKIRRTLRRQPDSLDSVDSSSLMSSSSCTQPSASSRRLRSKGASSNQGSAEQEGDERPEFSSRGTFNPEKSKQKLRNITYSLQRPPEDQGHNRDPDLQAQQLFIAQLPNPRPHRQKNGHLQELQTWRGNRKAVVKRRWEKWAVFECLIEEKPSQKEERQGKIMGWMENKVCSLGCRRLSSARR